MALCLILTHWHSIWGFRRTVGQVCGGTM